MDWKERAKQLRSRLEGERNELRRRARRATKEIRDELEGMEGKWKSFVARLSDVEISEVGEDVRETAEGLADELRAGYAKLRDRLRDSRDDAGSDREDAGADRDDAGADRKDAGADEASGDTSGTAVSPADAPPGRDDSAKPAYTMGYGEEFLQVLKRRSAETHAADLLPRLRSGMRVLDFGCGQGTISVGLAKAVDPGELHGIDVEDSQVAAAAEAAKAGGHENAHFRAGDVTDLPFEDEWFDVVHCNAVLMHVPDTNAALAEIARVLKPGGVVSVRELNTASSFMTPDFGNLDGAWQAYATLLAANGGHPQMGTEIKGILHTAGFAEVEANGSFELFHTDADREFFHGFLREWFFGGDVVEKATQHGIVAPEQFQAWSRSLDAWKEHPGAVAAFAWGGAIGRKS